ncbi:hypothetical protein C8F04DRAFT_1077499 [Mycena alexandri]|uniref:BTB domain-containing protein n=1 Tax=Mycena alexandri TaxID=1745969 RepID=A0AAD6TAI1_9AGAR|nr:hypothetical protein C8F04DRAFT_1077499 [Mycena alexandri]
MDIDKTLTRVEELWFFDGGLVVQAEQSLYRVSGGILSARSPVFKDMLSFTQPPNSETIDGCPVVKLHDSAADVTCFLRAIFDSSFFEPHPSPVLLDHVISVLHLSNKYSVEYLLRRGLKHLSSRYTTTLPQFDLSGEETSIILKPPTGNYSDIDLIPQIAVIQLAREVNAVWVIPTAFYRLASTREDFIEKILHAQTYHERPTTLSEQDRNLFLKFSLYMSHEAHSLGRFLYTPETVPGCETGQNCRLTRLSFLATLHETFALAPIPRLLGLISEDDVNDYLGDCCHICQYASREAIKDTRQNIWIPGFCGLPSWEALKEMKDKALEE